MTSTARVDEPGTPTEPTPHKPDDLLNLLGEALKTLVEQHISPEQMTLREVAARTGISHRLLWDECRAGRLEHYQVGNTYGMDRRQVALMLERYTKGRTDTSATVVPASDALARSRANASRGRGRAA